MNTKEIFEATYKVITRAEKLGINLGERISTFMDIELAAKEFNIDFDAWLAADDENFLHDYVGIYNNVDRVNKNFGLFVPRFGRC